MGLFASIRALFATISSRSRAEDEMAEELRSHVLHRADDLERGGLSRAAAERRARVEFGGLVKYSEQGYEARGGQWLSGLWQDLRLSARRLRKSPGFAAAAILTLALAIGANAVVFGVLNALVLRPLSVPDPHSLFAIERGSGKDANESYLDYLDIRERNRSFDDIALYNIATVGLDTGNNPEQAWGYEVSGNYFDALRIRPFLGSFFHGSDEHGPNSAPYLVISHDYWRTHFQSDPGIVGRVVKLNKQRFTILGVAPRQFQGTLLFFFPDFWVPVVDHQQLLGADILNARADRSFIMTLGHLKPGVTQAQAIADLNSVGAWLEKSYPKEDAGMTFALAQPSLAGDLIGPAARGFVTVMTLLAALILLAACANLGSLFAARAADGAREVALRLALGSSRRRILRQVFTEAVLISLAGGALGLAGSVAALRGISAWHPLSSFPSLHVVVDPDARVYVVALILALASGFLFGAVPVRQILRTHPYEVVKAGSSGVIPGNAGRRITARDVLLVVQIAVCAVLVTASLVAVRGLLLSMHSNFGFDPTHAMVVDTNLSMAGYRGDRVIEMQRRMMDALGTIPGVESVGCTNQLPLGGNFGSMDVYRDQTTDFRPANVAADPLLYSISPEYLNAAGTPLVAGRTFTWHDDGNAPPVAVVNRQFARKVFGSDDNAVGRYFKTGGGKRVQVVGLVDDGKYYQLTEDPHAAMFLPLLQSPSSSTTLVVRSAPGIDMQYLAGAVRSKIRTVDEGLPVDVGTWEQGLDIALFPSRVATVGLGVMGGMGAMLAITGIFGMAAYSVSKRLRELGIRMALGAQRGEVLRAALGRPVKLLVLGSAAGLGLGLLATNLLAYIVYQANPRDPLVLGGVVVAMGLLGLFATWVPAQRALAVDPMRLLRED